MLSNNSAKDIHPNFKTMLLDSAFLILVVDLISSIT